MPLAKEGGLELDDNLRSPFNPNCSMILSFTADTEVKTAPQTSTEPAKHPHVSSFQNKTKLQARADKNTFLSCMYSTFIHAITGLMGAV